MQKNGSCKIFPVTKHHAIYRYEGIEIKLRALLTSALNRGKWPPPYCRGNDSHKHGNAFPDSIKDKEFTDQVHTRVISGAIYGA
jgi:hypothetical protein